MTEPRLSGSVGHLLARAGMFQNCLWSEEQQAWKYHVGPALYGPKNTTKHAEEAKRMLPLVVPGLEVVGEETREFLGSRYTDLYFQWSRQALEKRYEELFEKNGVADERLEYMTCSGVDTYDHQARLPGVVEVEPRVSCGGYVSSAWAPHGLEMIEQGFMYRISRPNKGGPYNIPYNRRVRVGDNWWLVGSKGDSQEVLEIEIQASPLDTRVKENLLLNLEQSQWDEKTLKEYFAHQSASAS